MKKRIAMIFAVLMICACVFVGCNKKKSGEVTTTKEETTMTETTIEENLQEKVSSGVSKAVTDIENMATTTEKMAS